MLSKEFNHLRAEDHDLGSEAKFAELRRLYEAKVAASGVAANIQAMVRRYFDELGAAMRWTEQARRDAEPHHRESLVAFAARAYRRPLAPAERQALLAFYGTLRADGLSHEDAMRDAVASVIVSPQFFYRVDTTRVEAREQLGSYIVAPLDDLSLANRLSYFLWSSMPDAELLAHAARGDLRRRDVLVAQVRRMLRDERVSAARDGVRDELAGCEALRGVQQRRSRAVPQLYERPAAGVLRGARAVPERHDR